MIAPSEWRAATVVACEPAGEDMVRVELEPDDLLPHEAGQHYEVRFPGEELSRKFSIVSSPACLPTIEFGIQVLPTGLLSPRLAKMGTGDRLELRGPLGRAFVWTPGAQKSLLLLGAGAGITPLLSMWSRFHESPIHGTCRFVVSAKTSGRVYRYDHYRDEIETRFTTSDPRLSKGDVAALLSHMPTTDLSVRVCGPSAFIGAMVDALLSLGIEEDCIRSEGFA